MSFQAERINSWKYLAVKVARINEIASSTRDKSPMRVSSRAPPTVRKLGCRAIFEFGSWLFRQEGCRKLRPRYLKEGTCRGGNL